MIQKGFKKGILQWIFSMKHGGVHRSPGNVARKLSEEAGWVWCVHTVWGSYVDHTMIIHDPPTPPLPHTVWGLLPDCRDIFFPQESGRLDIWGKS